MVTIADVFTVQEPVSAACETRAGGLGCSEFAGDCEEDNGLPEKFRLAAGFEEAAGIIHFRKDIGSVRDR